MKQKRELFQKEIRRQALDNIFRQKRFECFGYSYNKNKGTSHYSETQIQQFQNEFEKQVSFQAGAIKQLLMSEDWTNLYHSINQCFDTLDKAFQKYSCQDFYRKRIISMWHELQIPQTLIISVQQLQNTNKNCFNVERKEIYKLALFHYHRIIDQKYFENTSIQPQDICNFLYLIFQQIKFEPQLIFKLFRVINSFVESKDLARSIFFMNKIINQDKSYPIMITFEHLAKYMLYENKKFYHQKDEELYCKIKFQFMSIFRKMGWYIFEIERYNKSLKKSQENKYFSFFQPDKQITQILQVYKNPLQLKLSVFIQKQLLQTVLDVIKSLKTYYIENLFEDDNQNNFIEVIQAFRLYVDHQPSSKLILTSVSDFAQIIELIPLKQVNIVAKATIIDLLDSVIYLDDEQQLTKILLRDFSLFSILLAYSQPSRMGTKLNIIANLALTEIGFQEINRYISEFTLSLYQSAIYISQILLIISNYLQTMKYDFQDAGPSFNLIISLLYSLKKDNFTTEDVLRQVNILNNLYENGFRRQPPERYHEWASLYTNQISLDQYTKTQCHQKFNVPQLAAQLIKIHRKKVQRLQFQ